MYTPQPLATLTQRIRRTLLVLRTPATNQAPPKAEKSPTVVRAGDALMLRAAHIFSGKLCRNKFGKKVFLLNGKDKVISIRPEYCDHNDEEHDEVVGYRALVWDMKAKESRFVDLASMQMLKVV